MKKLLLAVLVLGSVSTFASDLTLKCSGVDAKTQQKCSADIELEDSLGDVRFNGNVQCYSKEGKQTYTGGIGGYNFKGFLPERGETKSRFMLAGDNLSNLLMVKVHIGIPGEESSLYVSKLKVEFPVKCQIKRL